MPLPSGFAGVTIGLNPGNGQAAASYGYWDNLFADMSNMGLSWLRFQLSWRNIELSMGTYTWTALDNAVAAANANNIPILYTLRGAPDWALTQKATSVPDYQADPTLMAGFATAMISRYNGGAQGHIDGLGFNEDFNIRFTKVTDTLVLGSTITHGGGPYTTLTVAAAKQTADTGTLLYLGGYGNSTDVAVVSSPVAKGDTTVHISSFTPAVTYSSGIAANVAYIATNSSSYDLYYPGAGGVTTVHHANPARNMIYGANVFNAVAPAIRAVNATIPIGLPCTWWTQPINAATYPNSPSNVTASVQMLYDMCGPNIDANTFLDGHYYSNTVSPTTGSKQVEDITNWVNDFQTVSAANGDAGRSLWLTEFGWQVPQDCDSVTQANRYQSVLSAVIPEGNPNNNKVFFFTLFYPPTGGTGSSLVNPDGSHQPAYDIVSSFIAARTPTGGGGGAGDGDVTSNLGITVGGVQTLFNEDTFQLSYKVDERWRAQFTALDYLGQLFYTYGEQVRITDAALGRLFTGFLNTDTRDKSNTLQNIALEHKLDCMGNEYRADKRTSNRLYTEPTYAGLIVSDMVDDVLAAEGVTASYVKGITATKADFSQGTLSGVSATFNNDGDLELTYSGVSDEIASATDWRSKGSGSHLQVNKGGDVTLNAVTRDWDDGIKANQKLYSNGSTSDKIVGDGKGPDRFYGLISSAHREARSRLDFAGTWANGTIQVDVLLDDNVTRRSVTYRTTNWNNQDNTYAYSAELTSGTIRLVRGSNSGSGSQTVLSTHTFTQPLAHGWYTLTVVFSGSSHTISVNGKQYISTSDGTHTAAGYVALRVDNNQTSGTQTVLFNNFGVAESLSATWTQTTGASLSAIASIIDSQITCGDALSTGRSKDYTITVSVSTDNGSTYKATTNGGTFPGLPPGTSGSGKTVKVKVALATTSLNSIPHIFDLAWTVSGGYTSSGTRTSIPPAVFGTDTFTRANQSGWGTASDGQTWYFDDGTGTIAIASNEGNVSGDDTENWMRLGTSVAGDINTVVRLSLGGNADAAGIFVRAADTNNCYRATISAAAAALLIEVLVDGVASTLLSTPFTALSGTYYQLRFTTDGATLAASAWLDSTSEPSSPMLSGIDTTYKSGHYGLYALVSSSGSGGPLGTLSLYGTNSPASTVPTAGLLVDTTGASGNSQATTKVGTSTGYFQMYAQGTGTLASPGGSIGAADGNGWLFDSLVLEQQTLSAGVFTPIIRAKISVGSATADMYVRVYKRLSGGSYSTIGTLSLLGQSLGSTLATYAFGGGSLGSTNFGTGEKLYYAIWFNITANSSGSGTATIAITTSNSASLGKANNAELDTAGAVAQHASINFDNFSSSTQGVAPGLDLSAVGTLGSSSVSWNALLSDNTTLGVDISLDRGLTWTDISDQNGGPIPGLNDQPEPTVDTFGADSSANYVSDNGAGGAAGTWAYDIINGRLLASDGANAVYLYQDINRANIDLLCDMDRSDAGGLVWCYQDSNNYYSLVVGDNQAAIGTPNTMTLYRQASVDTPNLSFYATNTAAATIITARKAVTVLGATATVPAYSKCGTSTGYSELYSGGTTGSWAAAGSLGAPSGHGFFMDDASLEGATLPAGNWAPMLRTLCSIGTLTADLYVRAYVYHTGSATYTQIGSTLTLAAQTISTTPTNLQFGTTAMPAVTFATGDRFYWEVRYNITANHTGSSGAQVGIVAAKSATQGHRNACQIATTIEQPIPQVVLATATINFLRNTYHRVRATTSYGTISVSFDGVEAMSYTDPAPLPAGFPGLFQNGGIPPSWAARAFGSTVSYIEGAASYQARFYELWMQPLGDDMTNVIVDTRLRLDTSDPTVTPQVTSLTVAASDPHIGNGALIPSVDYRRTFLGKNLDDLCKKSNYFWMIDQFSALTFNHRQIAPAPWILQSTSIGAYVSDLEVDSTLVVEMSGDLYRNRQIVKGVTNVGVFTDNFVGDGQRTSFTLRYPLAETSKPVIKLSVDNTKQSVGLKGTFGHDWYYSPGDGTIAQDSGGTVLTTSDTLSVEYDGIFEDEVVLNNIAAQQALQAVAGGTGIVEDVIDVSNPGMLYPAALAYAQQLLDRYCLSGHTITCNTYRSGLQVGMVWPAYVPEEGLYGAQLFISAIDLYVQSQTNNTRLYKYQVQASELPPVHSWQKLLASGLGIV